MLNWWLLSSITHSHFTVLKIIKTKYVDIINTFRLFKHYFYFVLFCIHDDFISYESKPMYFTVAKTTRVKNIDIINIFRIFKHYFYFVLFWFPTKISIHAQFLFNWHSILGKRSFDHFYKIAWTTKKDGTVTVYVWYLF